MTICERTLLNSVVRQPQVIGNGVGHYLLVRLADLPLQPYQLECLTQPELKGEAKTLFKCPSPFPRIEERKRNAVKVGVPVLWITIVRASSCWFEERFGVGPVDERQLHGYTPQS